MRILIIDLGSIFWSAAMSSAQQEIGAPYEITIGKVAMLRDGYDRTVVACDAGKSFRTAIDPAYKANRPKKDPAMVEQLRRVQERLAADGCHVIIAPPHPDHEGVFFEADDVIGTVCAWCAANNHDAVIVSGDKDLSQLVTNRVLVQRPDERRPMGAADCEAALGVHPHKVADWLALCGDTSDNFKPFPGYQSEDGKSHPGIGEKGAASLIALFGNAPAAVRAALSDSPDPRIRPAVLDVLRRGGMAAVNKGLALATICRDVPIDCEEIATERPRRSIAKEPIDEGTPMSEQQNEVGETEQAGSGPAAAIVTGKSDAIDLAKPSPLPARVAGAPIDCYAIQPRSLGEAWRLSGLVFNSRLFGQFPSQEAICTIILAANERGIAAVTALQHAYVVKGKVAWSAAFLVGLILQSGKADVFEVVESTDAQATVVYQRKGRPEGRFTYTIAEAQAAGIVNGQSMWQKIPRTMLRWAALREAGRAFFADVVANMYTKEELEDFDR